MNEETYFGGLYAAVHDQDQRNMSSDFAKFFNEEADSEGFTRGKKSFFVVGDNADSDCRAAYACLVRGGYNVVSVPSRSIVRRLDSKWIPRWGDEDDKLLEAAEVIILHEAFDTDFMQSITSTQAGDLVWFIRDAIHNGVVVIIPSKSDIDLNMYGEAFGEFVETNFEAYNGAASTDTRNTPSDKSKHGGDAASSKYRPKRKRKDTKGTKP